MPSKYTMDSLPTPNDDVVRLVPVPSETVAVLRYSGLISTASTESHARELLDTLRDNGIEPAGEPFSWFYDPPWTVPFLRRNELAVVIDPSA